MLFDSHRCKERHSSGGFRPLNVWGCPIASLYSRKGAPYLCDRMRSSIFFVGLEEGGTSLRRASAQFPVRSATRVTISSHASAIVFLGSAKTYVPSFRRNCERVSIFD